MFESLLDPAIWASALIIFSLRIADVAMGTMRTIWVVQGRMKSAMVLGFFEVLIWITAIAHVLQGIQTSWLLTLAYAAGFAAGNAVGVSIDRRLALGMVEIRMISARAGREIASRLREQGRLLTTFLGEGRDGQHLMIYSICPRRELREVLFVAREIDPEVVYSVDAVHEYSTRLKPPVPHFTGWRAVLKKK